MVLKKDDKKEKTVMYIIETINILVENQKVLFKRINDIEGHLDMLAGRILDDIDKDNRTIN